MSKFLKILLPVPFKSAGDLESKIGGSLNAESLFSFMLFSGVRTVDDVLVILPNFVLPQLSRRFEIEGS